jgi:hypothetical protein
MKRFYIPEQVKTWIEDGNYYEKTERGFILFSGYFSGDNIPSSLKDMLSNLYNEYGVMKIEFIPKSI